MPSTAMPSSGGGNRGGLAVVPRQAPQGAAGAAIGLSADTLAALVLQGDMSRLTPAQKVEYYRARCDAAGLDPRAQPFAYLRLNGREILYATKACTDQLTGLHSLTVEITDRRLDRDAGIYEVQCRVKFPGGRHVEDAAAVPIAGLKGESLANSLMKCVTKAKRRTILSACGLGMLDETEVETIPDARPVRSYDVDSGTHEDIVPEALPRSELPTGGDPRTDKAFREWSDAFLRDVNTAWLDHWSNRLSGDLTGVPDELLGFHRFAGHMVKHYDGPKTQNASHRVRFLGIKLRDDPEGFDAEARDYANALWLEQEAKVAESLGLDAIESQATEDDYADGYDPAIDNPQDDG